MNAKDQILVVDDEAANRKLLRILLGDLGYRVREACDGVDALSEVGREAPDLILTDLRMPRCDGFDLCRTLKQDVRTRLIPVVMITTLGALPDKLRALDLGADEFLSKPFDPLELKARVQSLLSLKKFTSELEHASQMVESLALVVEGRDRYTGNHCRRLGDYGVAVGRAMGLAEEDLRILRMGGILHDLGKIAIPDAVLNKPGKLTFEEYDQMKTHPIIGAELCSGLKTLEKVLPVVRHHHEKLDGSGYPDRLKGDEISIHARIVSVVDVYDALSTRRPYKEPLALEACAALIRGEVARGWWDRDVVETLLSLVAKGEAPFGEGAGIPGQISNMNSFHN